VRSVVAAATAGTERARLRAETLLTCRTVPTLSEQGAPYDQATVGDDLERATTAAAWPACRGRHTISATTALAAIAAIPAAEDTRNIEEVGY
jgi:hypothetical protein